MLEHLTIENAVLSEFDSHLRRLFGGHRKYMRLPIKAKAMLADISELRKLNWMLLNVDAVQFHVALTDLRASDFQLDSFVSFSIFKYTDDETHTLISRLAQLAKERVFKVIRREADQTKENKKGRSYLERNYGHLYHGAAMNKWLLYADKACEKLPSLLDAEG